MMPSRLAAEDLLAYVGDLARARGRGVLAAFPARAAGAARADDARRCGQRIAYPGDVEHVGDRLERLGRIPGDACLAAPVQALTQDRRDGRCAVDAVGIERGRAIDADREDVRIARHVAPAHRVAAVQERLL